jgi:hypothetical protein
MRIDDQLEALELIDLISDCIEMSIPYIIVLDNKDREVVLYLPEPQTAGTEYQKHTYSINAAQKVVQAFFSIEDYEEDIRFYDIDDN